MQRKDRTGLGDMLRKALSRFTSHIPFNSNCETWIKRNFLKREVIHWYPILIAMVLLIFFGLRIFDVLQSTEKTVTISHPDWIVPLLISVLALAGWLIYNKTKSVKNILNAAVFFSTAILLEVSAAVAIAALLIKEVEPRWFILLVLFTAIGLFLIGDILRSSLRKFK